MKTILAAASAMMLMTGAAFADSTALDNQPTPFDYQGNADAELVGFFADEEGMMRTDEDFEARVAAATPEQMEGLGTMCTELEEDKVLWSDKVSSRCKMISDNM